MLRPYGVSAPEGPRGPSSRFQLREPSRNIELHPDRGVAVVPARVRRPSDSRARRPCPVACSCAELPLRARCPRHHGASCATSRLDECPSPSLAKRARLSCSRTGPDVCGPVGSSKKGLSLHYQQGTLHTSIHHPPGAFPVYTHSRTGCCAPDTEQSVYAPAASVRQSCPATNNESDYNDCAHGNDAVWLQHGYKL